MKSFRYTVLTVLFVLPYWMFPPKAYAYIDPGTGSYILQLILGAFLAGLFVVKLLWNKIKSFFKNLFSREAHESDAD